MTEVKKIRQEVLEASMTERGKELAGYMGIDDPRTPSSSDISKLIDLVKHKTVIGYDGILEAAKVMPLELDVANLLEPFKHINMAKILITDREILLILAVQIRRELDD